MAYRMLHAPRTGGSSIRVSWDLSPPEYRGHAQWTPEDAERFCYGFTRNPWTRVVSLYEAQTPRRAESDFPCLADWVLGTRNNYHGTSLGGHWIHHPVLYWLRRADWVGRYERREEGLGELAERLGRPVPLERYDSRTAERLAWEDYWTDEAVARVGEIYADDVEMWGYTFPKGFEYEHC